MWTLAPDLGQAITQRLVEALQPEPIILCGSHVWGVPNDDSDVDLLVIVANDDASAADLRCRARRALRGLNVPKDILVRTRAEIERARRVYASLEREILDRGTVLYG